MKVRLASQMQSDSIVDGEGIRTVIWAQGCLHNCEGCHNLETHSFENGILTDVEELKEKISNLKGQDGITFSGGDPMFQMDAFLEIAKHCKQNDLNVWCYTGFTFEELLKMSKKNDILLELMQNIDVLVDGKFIEEKKSYDLYFRGSVNQRIIDVQESMNEKRAVEIEKYRYLPDSKYIPFGKTEFMFI